MYQKVDITTTPIMQLRKLLLIVDQTLADMEVDLEVLAIGFRQHIYIRPVYVKSVEIAGGYIPAWVHARSGAYGDLYLQYSM